jgi:hypothetical protein
MNLLIFALKTKNMLHAFKYHLEITVVLCANVPQQSLLSVTFVVLGDNISAS